MERGWKVSEALFWVALVVGVLAIPLLAVLLRGRR